MSDKPSYLGLLNAIAVAERRGHAVFTAWRDTTTDPELVALLDRIAIREAEHAAAFTKRLCDLGFSLREPAAAGEETLAVAASSASDADKFRQLLGYGNGTEVDDPLDRMFEDRSIDPQTGALLGRFIAEERDSERQLRAACARVTEAANGSAGGADEERVLADIAVRIDRLSQTLEDLKKLRF